MDNLCHTLAGVALGDAGLKRRTALGMGTLIVASNLPDIDVAVFATDTLAVSFRRGWTHGVLSMVVLPAMFAGLMLAVDRVRVFPTRERANLRGLLLLSYTATWLHVFMDYLNSYGVRLLMPFSNRWFYGDALYIVDPLLYVIFGSAIVVGRMLHRRGHATPTRPAQAGLVVAASYIGLMLASNVWARAEVREGLARAGRADTRFMVTPVFANPIRREVIVDTGERYEKGVLWFAPAPHFRPAGFGVDTNRSHPVAQAAARTPLFNSYLRWSRFPFFAIANSGNATRVYLNDYRYSGESVTGGWAGVSLELPRGRIE
jgi:inner membrane protein